MILVLVAMIAGIVSGYFLRGRPRLFRVLDPLTAWIVRLLLFLLGVGIGADRELLAQVPELGARGLSIAAASIAGSVAAARIMLGRFTPGTPGTPGTAGKADTAGTAGTPGTPGTADTADTADGNPAGGARFEGTPGNGFPAEVSPYGDRGARIGEAPSGMWNVLRGSLAAAVAFALGVLSGVFAPMLFDWPFDPATPVLYVLMLIVGIAAGADPTIISTMRKQGVRMALLPLAVIIGTLAGSFAVALAWPGMPVRESLAVGAGFGYYSLSSLVIRELSGGDWAAVALLSNISREILTLLAAPLLTALGGPAAPAAAGGATSMDTTLAATVQCSGRAWAVPALFSGVVLSLLVPFAVTLILGS